MQLVTRHDLDLGGFAGLRERIYVMDPRRFGDHTTPGSREGFEQLVYLADAIFLPRGSTGAHDHQQVDIISVLVRGHLRHEGSLGHGETLEAGEVQVQYAGAEGFRHNEINPAPHGAHMIQLWMQPLVAQGPARYRNYRPAAGQLTRVYGDEPGTNTAVDIWPAHAGQQQYSLGPTLGFLVNGQLHATEAGQRTSLAAETLFQGEDLQLEAEQDSLVILLATTAPFRILRDE